VAPSLVSTFHRLVVHVQISLDTSFFRGMLSLVNDIYLPYAASVFPALSAIIKRYIACVIGILVMIFSALQPCCLLPLLVWSRDPPALLVADIGMLAAIDAAELHGIPLVLNHPSTLLQLEDPPHALPGSESAVLCGAVYRTR